MGEKNKGNVVLWLILILVLVMVGVLSFFVYNQEKEIQNLKKQKAAEGIKAVNLGGEETEVKEDVRSKYKQFYTKLTDKIAKSCPDVRINETADKKDSDGFFWIEKEEKVEFVKGDSIILNYSKEGYDKECMEMLGEYFADEFSMSKLNSKKGLIDAYEKEDVKCQVWMENQSLSCGIIVNESNIKIYKDLYPYLNPDFDPDIAFKINKSEGEFYLIAVGPHFAGGQTAIWKKSADKWERLLKYNEFWECDTVISKKIPPILVENECIYKTSKEVWKYDEEQETWIKTLTALPTKTE